MIYIFISHTHSTGPCRATVLKMVSIFQTTGLVLYTRKAEYQLKKNLATLVLD
jgi:hypothetical protein